MTLLEECCKRIVNERMIEWFNARHAKVLSTIKKYEKLLASEIVLITSIEKATLLQTLYELRTRKLISHDGEKYHIPNEAETLNSLLEMAERETVKILAKSKH
ncbi:MAG: hypothetical protein J4478_00085 [Candidatus Diapherotrites archaeon]|uniref:Uncharacterized protein n=1 Tax=Candidatus Iainarchaeum sp. TaxID=3101447 RepID=A0A7J4JV95_9ARCH|nr:hypothetical protein [Candidatus Diapherotrites archaeon]HIH21394.1 hypothetical protein [Candidatus Diapherotrites archaeon]